MIILLSVFKVLLPMLYLVTWAGYLWVFLSDHPIPRRWCSRMAAVTVVIHIISSIVRGIVLGRLPMGAPLEFSSLLAESLLLTYLLIEGRWRVKQTGFLVVGVAFVLQFVASAFSTTAPAASPLLRDPGFAGHAVLVLLAYVAMSLSFIYAVLYLVQSRQLARKSFGLLFRRLPPLDVLEKMSVGAVELGVPLLFGSLVLGHLRMYSLWDHVEPDMVAQLSPWDPKIMVSWAIFLAYVVGWIGHKLRGWRGRRMSILAVVAYVTLISAMGFVHHFLPSFHDFRSTRNSILEVDAKQSRGALDVRG